jgi:leader peptidase (prepilin peptidase)/N-methyltransferase
MIEQLLADPAAATAAAFVLGLLVGSFLNVVILRLPRRLEWQWRQDARDQLEMPESYEPAPPGIAVESSHCPHCGHKLSWYENIPVLSFAVLRGKCRACGARISWQYPFVELLTAVLFAACAWRFGAGFTGAMAMAFSATLVALAGIDLRTTLLPDALTMPLLWTGLLLSLVTVFVDPVQAILGAAAGYLFLWSVYWLFKLVTGKEGMGAGDFKLLAALGAWCGLTSLLGILLLSSLVGAIVGGTWLLARGKDRSTQIPFGPYLAIAGWLVFYFQFDLFAQVLRWSAPS